MITSRTADKHRNRAAELGVERFLGKPYQEDELLQSLRAVTMAVEDDDKAVSTTLH
jgi:chemosensory pili system protein ChpA (sensor histidine kinase/response regulator)